MCQLGAFDDLFVAERIAIEVRVLATDAAVEAILGADVAVFDESAQVDIVVQMLQLGLQCFVEEQLLVVAFGLKQCFDVLFFEAGFI